ncbi:hypothetical protein E2C01_030499 [Portunus trituberculatus]|uniref:Uncharacterized protein n=1 Tax=Portunus trituberculatus TaxID=210409 RepID=A0A5B7EV06_PORTR|nr:hypothetical protein [Portunus trituberculatus]
MKNNLYKDYKIGDYNVVLVFVEGQEYLAAISVEVRGPRSLRGRYGACVCSVLVRFPGLPLIRSSRLKKNQETEAEPTFQASPRRETADQDDAEEPHTIHYQLRSKNPGTRREDLGPSKMSFSDLIKGFEKYKQDRRRGITKQHT